MSGGTVYKAMAAHNPPLGLTTEDSAPVPVRITLKLRDQVDTFAAQSEQTRSAYIRHIIEQEMARLEAEISEEVTVGT